MKCGEALRPRLGRDFALLWQGYAFSAAGNLLYGIAIGIWVYDNTGSAALMGILSAISYLASFFLQPFAGVLADLLDKRLLIVAADGVRGILMLLLGLAALNGHLAVWEVLAVAGAAALCNVCFVPAAFSALSLIVPGRELMRAQSLIQGTASVIRLIGNAASGALVLWLGVPPMILLNGICFLLSALSELFIRIPKSGQQQPAGLRDLLAGFAEGFCYLGQLRGVVIAILAGAAVNLFCGGFSGVVYVWCLDKGMSLPQYGFFLGAESGAALAGALVLSAFPPPPSIRAHLFVLAYLVQTFFGITAMAAPGFLLSAALYGISAFFNSVTNMMLLPALLQIILPAYRGRAVALFSALSDGGMALSMLLYGLLADRFGVLAVAFGGALLALLPAISFCTNRALLDALGQE